METHSLNSDIHKDNKFSILIPTWNNLPYLKLCVESINKNSRFSHQIIIHVNEGSDGTLDWVRLQGLEYTFSDENVGVCVALNSAARLAKTDYIVFFNDDMYALPNWDQSLIDSFNKIPHQKWFLSATMIEPKKTGNRCALAPFDFGDTVENFEENLLLSNFDKIPFQDWSGSTWPPNIVPKKLWDAVGGYSEEFSPGMGSDPDFSMKLWQLGVRHFQGVSESRVYHFQCKSTGKVKKNPGHLQFLNKWNVTSGTFSKYYLRRGEPFKGPLQNPGPFLPYILARVFGAIKRFL
jgi:GT2 family glycosyltransferase